MNQTGSLVVYYYIPTPFAALIIDAQHYMCEFLGGKCKGSILTLPWLRDRELTLSYCAHGLIVCTKHYQSMARKDLAQAKDAKKDEFYTQLDDIAKELKYYKPYFKDKVVLCNCDDPYESNFFKYFALNFNALGLKKLIATCYNGSPIAGDELPLLFDVTEQEPKKIAYKVEITEVQDYNNDGAVNLADVVYLLQNDKNVLTKLKGNGDFRSQECIELLKQADIVVTNPPFSLFREYIAQLVEYDKLFLIIGNVNAITFREFFPLIKTNKVWMGASIHSGDREFQVPESYPLKAAGCRVDERGRKYIRVKGVRWFTNLDYPQRHEDLILYKKYTPEEYPKYDNYEAININVTADIPCDYDGVMGVPITFLDKYNPDQFEIIGAMTSTKIDDYNFGYPYVNGKKIYARILIRRRC